MSDAAFDRLAAALADRYGIERKLGQGGMATVYLAQDQRHDRKVALKVMRPDLAAVIGVERFLAEIKTTANLQHPNILPLHDSGEVDGTVFYVMPFVEGESLRDRLNREKQLPVPDAVRIATEVAGALDYAHRKGIIHRDVKPENILLHDGRALVADFGIALAASRSEGSARITETGMSLGTPHYMSPEQAMGERDLDGRADVYAVGCVLYEMLTGEPPFDGPTAQAIVAKVMSADPVPIAQLRRTVPPHVAAAADIALHKLPADRFGSAAELAAALQDPARMPTGVHGARTVPPARPRVATLMPWTVAVIAAGVAAWLGLSRSNEPVAGRPVRFAVPAVAGTEYGGRIAIAPDGGFIVYSAASGGVTRLYRRDLANPEPRPLPGTQGAMWPTVSPDGNALAFVGPDQSVYELDLRGERRRRVVELTNPPIGIGWSRAHGLVFGMLAFSRVNGLSVITADGDSVRMITEPRRSMHHEPYVPAGGDVVLFQNTSDLRLGLASLADGEVALLDIRVGALVGLAGDVFLYLDQSGTLMAVRLDIPGRRLVGSPMEVPDVPEGVEAAVLADDGTLVLQLQPQAFRVEIVDERGVGEVLLPDTVTRVTMRYAPDGSRVALVGGFRGGWGVWMLDRRSGILSTLPVGSASGMEWTPDGRGLTLMRYSRREVRWAPADASAGDTVLYELPDGMVGTAASLAPDGRSLLIQTLLREGGYNLFVATLGPRDTVLEPFAAGSANEMAGRFSPDGRWIAYASDESGGVEVYVRPFPGSGARTQVSTDGGSQPVWGPDGRRLFYRSGRALVAVDLVADGADGAVRVGGRRRLFEGDFFGGEGLRAFASYDVAPDGRHFLMARAIGDARSEMVVWVNWLDELKARLGN